MRNLILVSAYIAFFLSPSSYGTERLVVFGDSLSDVENSFALTGGAFPPGPPQADYGETFGENGAVFPGRFTDGKNWVDYFSGIAKRFGVDILPATAFFQDTSNSDENATDFAISGSTSGALNGLNAALPSFPFQIDTYLHSPISKSAVDDLCVIWIGANDFAAKIDPLTTVSNIKGAITQLAGVGVKNFAVIAIPDISFTPEIKAQGGGTVFAAKQFVYTANFALALELPRFALQNGIRIDLVEINKIAVPVFLEPTLFGFTNSSGFAYVPLYGPLLVSDPDQYVFWDGFHPTTNVHKIAAEFIATALFSRRANHEFLSLR